MSEGEREGEGRGGRKAAQKGNNECTHPPFAEEGKRHTERHVVDTERDRLPFRYRMLGKTKK